MRPPAREHFTAEEAEALRGRRFEATRGYSGVPAATHGVVVGSYKAGQGLFGVDVEWQRPEDIAAKAMGGATVRTRYVGFDHYQVQRPLVDGFSKGDMEVVFPDGTPAMREIKEA